MAISSSLDLRSFSTSAALTLASSAASCSISRTWSRLCAEECRLEWLVCLDTLGWSGRRYCGGGKQGDGWAEVDA